MPNPFITDEQAIETPDGSMEVPGEPTTQSVVAKEPTEGPTVEPVNPVPLPPAQPFDPYAVLERNAYSASQFVLGKDSGRTAEVLDISRQLGISPAEVDADFEGSKQRLEKLRTANTLKQSPGLSDYITNNPDKAPVLKNDLKPLTKTDILLNELAEKMAASNPAEPPKSLTYADEETEWKREDEDYEPEVKTLDGWRAGYLSGELQNEQGRMYEDLRLGKITKDAAFEKRSKEIDDTLAALDEKFKDSWLSYPTMKTIGQMLTVSGDTAAKGAALGMGAGALGLGALALAGAPVAVPASLGALGLMTMSGAVMETSKEVEGGLAYKDMREAGIDDDVARRLSGTVGFVNGSLEAIGDAVLTKFGGKLLGITGFKQMFGQKVKEKTIEALKKPTFRAAAVDVAKAFTTGLATEVGVEELQEISNIVAEEAAKKLTKDVQFDSITPDEVMDRLADIGIETIKGVWALGLAGGAVGMTRHISKIKTAQRNQEFFENLNQIAPEITARETAPGVVSEAVQNQAESAGKPTIYVDGEMFAQTMQEKNVRLEDLKKINPELVNAIQKAVASGGDVEISTGDYAAHIAGTPFGEALTQHLRFNPDELSAYEAKKARKLVSDWVGQNDWDLSTEEGREAATKEINQAVIQVQKSKYAQAFDDLTKSMTQSLMASGISGYREERIAKQYARLQAASIVRLAKDANIAPERIAEFAPRIESSNVTRDAFFQEPLDAAEKLRADAQQWKETVDKLTAKPRQQLIMLRQTPLIMKLLGADFQELRSSTHVFDGVYPGNKSRDEHHEHLMMTKDVIKQIPEAITDPVIVARDERHNSFVFFLDIKDANGESVMVPVSFEHPTEKKPVVFNIVKSAFGRGRLQLELQGRNNALLYINIKKLKSLYGTPGADSLRSVKDFNAVLKNYFSNADGSSVKTEADLVKLRELFPGYYQTSIQDPLITVHNISEENLNKSLDLGGFAVPSLGITKQRTPYADFGEISLIGTRDMVDPSRGTPVFSQDAYTARFPQPDWSKSLNTEKATPLVKEIMEAKKEVNENGPSGYYYLQYEGDRDKAIKDLLTHASGMYLFIKHKGIPFTPIKQQAKKPSFAAGIVSDFVDNNGLDVSTVEEGSAAHKKISDGVVEALREKLNEPTGLKGLRMRAYGDNIDAYEKTGFIPFKLIEEVKKYEVERKKAEGGDAPVSSGATQLELEKLIAPMRDEFEKFISDKVNSVYSAPLIKVGNSYRPITLQNVVEAMKSSAVSNKESTLFFGPGKVRAAAARRFDSIEDIQGNRDLIADSQTVNGINAAANDKMSDFRDLAARENRGDEFSTSDRAMEALAKVAGQKSKPTPARMKSALKKYGFEPSDETVKLGVEILNDIKKAMTDYFEAKPQRAVGADEFRGAVVPEGTSEATIRRLEKAGITVAKYDAEVEGARERVIRDLTNRLNEKTGDILFQNEKIEPQSINVSATEVFAKLGLELPDGFRPSNVTLISTKPVTEKSNIEEFSGAVLPDNAPKELVDALEEKGIRVELSSNRKTVRAKAVSQLSQKIQDSLVYFQNETNERGGYSPKQNTIHLTPNADLSTFAHEMSHWYLENLMQLAGETGVSGLIKQDAETLLKDFGLQSLDEWKNLSIEEKRKFHERFAYQTEIYLATGKPHNPKLITVFKNLGKWIRDVYRAWTGGVAEQRAAQYKSEFGEELPQLSEEVQRVMDRMLNAEADLYQAEVSESMRPLFDEKPKDMSEEDWIAMQKAHDEALADGEAMLNEAKAKDEKWYTNARAKTLRMIQRKAKEIRDKVKEGVTAEIEAEAGTRAYELIKKSNETFGINWKFDPEALTAAKISSSAIKKLSALGLTKKGGMAPSEVMELMRGQGNAFATVQDMVQGLLDGARKDERIEEETTRRCIEKYSENFTQAGIDAQITEALQNEARARFVATEFKYLAGSPAGISQRMINEAAKRSAELMLANMPVYNVNPRNFVAMQARASRKAYEALASGDKGRAAAYKRQQLMYLQAALQALDVDKQVDRFERIRKKTFSADKKLAKTYDLDVLNVLRAVFNIEGLGRTKPEDVDLLAVEKSINAFKDMAPPVYEMLSGVFSRYKGINGGQGYSNLTYGDFQALAEDVNMLFAMSRQWKETTREAKAEAREQAAKELIAQMNTQNLTYHSVGQTEATTPFEKFRQDGLLSLGSSLVRVESWCNKMDTGNPNHPFRSHIYDPIAQATAKFRNRNSELQQKLAELIKPQQKDWLSRTDIHAPTLNYTFRTKAELIGALLHTGNESNKEKLLLGGRGEGNAWAEMVEDQEGNTKLDTKRWDQFIAQCYADGTITKADMDFVQLVWNLLESTKEDAQKAYKDLYGYTFKEIEASPIQTPWGEYRGGYVPATTDKYLVADKATFDEIDRITEQDYLSAMPVSQPGFTKSRASGYHEPLSFDVAIISNHISSVLKFCYIAPVAQDVGKLLLNKDLSEKLNAQDPTTLRDMLKPWLKRSYSQQVSDGRSGWVSKKLNELRGIAGINIMMGHVANALQQFTGFSIALTKVSGRNLIDAAGVFARDPRKVTEQITQLSQFMMSRLNDRAMEFQSQVYKISSTQDNRVTKQKGIFNKTVAAKAKYIQPVHDFLMRKGYFLQSLCQIPIDAITWVGAYNQALQKGRTTEEAVLDADSVIRTTMSDFSPENVANVETGNALYRSFLVFYNYFNMQFNLLNERFHADSMEKKLIKRYGMYARDALLVVTIPSVVAKLIEAVVFGDPDTGDDDEFGMDDMLRMLASESFKNAVAMAPIAGQFINTAGASLAKDQKGGAVSDVAKFIWGTDPYVGRIMTAPAYGLIEGSGKAIQQTVEILNDEDVNARSYTRNMLDLLSVVTGLPLGFLKKPLGYMAGVEAGDIQPADAGEFVQGVLSGRAKKD
jgi:hypothetical protein|nr:MAG TPA: crystallin beta/gamma motif-containing protein [Caudoviricetes sp.]